MSSNLTLSAIFIMASLVAAGPTSAADWYRSAIAAMQSIGEPAYASYRTTVPPGDSTIVISRGDDGRAEMSVLDGPSEAQSWDVVYRGSDGTAAMTLDDGTRALSHLAIFDPTWRGAFTWLRKGIASDVAPLPALSPQTSASPGETQQPSPPIIAVVGAIDERGYAISDGGDANCADGRPGHRVWTKARSDPQEHPLTEAVIDRASLRFCTLLFREHIEGPTIMLDLDIELHFGQAGAYYLTTDGIVTGAVRPYKRPGWFPLHTTFRYDRFAFPASLPASLFSLPPG